VDDVILHRKEHSSGPSGAADLVVDVLYMVPNGLLAMRRRSAICRFEWRRQISRSTWPDERLTCAASPTRLLLGQTARVGIR